MMRMHQTFGASVPVQSSAMGKGEDVFVQELSLLLCQSFEDCSYDYTQMRVNRGVTLFGVMGRMDVSIDSSTVYAELSACHNFVIRRSTKGLLFLFLMVVLGVGLGLATSSVWFGLAGVVATPVLMAIGGSLIDEYQWRRSEFGSKVLALSSEQWQLRVERAVEAIHNESK